MTRPMLCAVAGVHAHHPVSSTGAWVAPSDVNAQEVEERDGIERLKRGVAKVIALKRPTSSGSERDSSSSSCAAYSTS
jgi:hypothetical protein